MSDAIVRDDSAALRYEQLIQIYGPVFSYRQGDRITVVVGRYQVSKICR